MTGAIDPSPVVAWQAEVVRLRYTRRLRKASEGYSDWPALSGHAGVLSRVYQSLAKLTGARVIVDSSKRPAIGTLLRALPGVSHYVVHLVRDPRAVAYSYKRTRKTVDREMKREGSVEVTLTPNHTAGGNPSRFETGRIARLDKEWVARQKPGDRKTTAALTLPLLKSYGYPFVSH